MEIKINVLFQNTECATDDQSVKTILRLIPEDLRNKDGINEKQNEKIELVKNKVTDLELRTSEQE